MINNDIHFSVIGQDDYNSCTTIPIQLYVIDEEGNTSVWDCPGAADTKGLLQEIANAFNFDTLLGRVD